MVEAPHRLVPEQPAQYIVRLIVDIFNGEFLVLVHGTLAVLGDVRYVTLFAKIVAVGSLVRVIENMGTEPTAETLEGEVTGVYEQIVRKTLDKHLDLLQNLLLGVFVLVG